MDFTNNNLLKFRLISKREKDFFIKNAIQGIKTDILREIRKDIKKPSKEGFKINLQEQH